MDDLTGFRSPARLIGHPAVVKSHTGSTNDDARELAARGAPHGALVVADAQTAGRGRQGRAWISPPGENLYASFVLRPRRPAAACATLSLVVGLAVAEALEAHARGARMQVKWPNDVRVGGRKLAGVLVEGSLRGDEFAWLVVGVGVNVRGERAPAGVEDIATTLRALRGEDIGRGVVLASLCERLEARLGDWERGGFEAVRGVLEARCETLGARVKAEGAEGVAEGIADDGALRVQTDAGAVVLVRAGEV